MNSLPPEMILKIYQHLNAKAALKFSETSKGINKVFNTNRSRIPRFGVHLDVTFKKFIIVMSYMIRKKRVVIELRYKEGVKLPEIEMLDFIRKSALPSSYRRVGESATFDTPVPIETFKMLMDQIPQLGELVAFECTGHLNDDLLQLLCDCLFIDQTFALSFHCCTIDFENYTLWSRLLEQTKPNTLDIYMCQIASHPLFTTNIMETGLKNLSSVNIKPDLTFVTSSEKLGLKCLFNKKTLTRLTIDVDVRCDAVDIVEKLQGWYEGSDVIEDAKFSFDSACFEQISEKINSMCVEKILEEFWDQIMRIYKVRNTLGIVRYMKLDGVQKHYFIMSDKED